MERSSVNPEILRVVGDVGRPERGYNGLPDTTHIPGADGVLAGLTNLWGWMRHGHQHLQAQASERGPVYKIRLGSHKFVVVSDPKMVGEVLRNGDKTWSTALGWLVQFGGITDGPMDSPVTLDFQPHRDVRRLLQPAFGADALETYIAAAVPIFEESVEQWVAAGRVTFKPAVRNLFARASAKVFMGVDDPQEAVRLDEAMTRVWGGSLALSKNAWLSPAWRRARRAYQSLFEHFRSQVEERRAGASPDLFSRLCRTNQAVEWLDDDALVRLFLAVMTAAFDTTSAGVTSMAYLLATHEKWRERLQIEALRTTHNRISYARLRELKLHDLAWKETLRFYPVAPSLPRTALRDVTLGGYRIPAGTVVSVLLTSALRDPSCWESPNTFDPERFSSARNEGKRSHGAYMPFGAGVHACIGAQLSGLEAKAFWHTLGVRAGFRLAEPYQARHEFRPLGSVSGRVELVLAAL